MCDVRLLRVSVHERISAAAEDFLLQVEKGGETAQVPVLRALLTERLTAAADEIVAVFEETMAVYEDRMERSAVRAGDLPPEEAARCRDEARTPAAQSWSVPGGATHRLTLASISSANTR